MSCDTSASAYATHLSRNSNIAAQLGGGDPARAKDTILQIQELATTRAQQAQEARKGTPSHPLAKVQQEGKDAQASEATTLIFRDMQRLDIKPPSHGEDLTADGFALPEPPARHGWQAVKDTLTAIHTRQALPPLAQEVVRSHEIKRRIGAVERDNQGRGRCVSCGQYANPQSHTCPMTTNADALGRKLQRMLGVLPSAYGEAALTNLIQQARQGPITMRHGLTGEPVEVTLDGLPSALAGGFVPNAWRQGNRLALAQISPDRVVAVLNPDGLNVFPRPAAAVDQTAAAYGTVFAPNTPVGGALGPALGRTQQVQQSATTTVIGGRVYDRSHFLGSEYRRGGSQGGVVQFNGANGQSWNFAVGETTRDPNHFSSARDLSGATSVPDLVNGVEPLPAKDTIVVGRTMMEAVGLLHTGEVVETSDGVVEVYEAGRARLLAMYDPRNNTAGDVAGAINVSAPQIAAVMAYRALHPQNGFDVALTKDLSDLDTSQGHPHRAADSMYIVARNNLFADINTVTFGGLVGTQRCVQCGQFMGDAHICPAGPPGVPTNATAAPAQPIGIDPETIRTTIAEAMAAVPLVPISPQVAVNVALDETKLAEALATAITQAQPVQPGVLQIDEDKLAAALRAGMPQQAGTAQFDAEALVNALQAVLPQQTVVQFDAEALADALQRGLSAQQAPQINVQFDTAALAEALQRGLSARQEAPAITVQLDPAALAEAFRAIPAPVVDTTAFSSALQATLTSVAEGRIPAAVSNAPLVTEGGAPITVVSDPVIVQAMQQMAQAAQRMSEVAAQINNRVDTPAPSAQASPIAEFIMPATPVQRAPRTGLQRPENLPLTAQEHIFSNVRLPAPDPYLMDVPIEVGGQRTTPLNEYIPELLSTYEVGETNEKILRGISAMIQAGQKGNPKESYWSRAFGLYGPAGTGKNTMLRQIAASIQTVDTDGNITQGMPYSEYNVLPDSTLEDALGTVVLESDGRGGTRSTVKLGKIGLALAMGSVVAINEIARNEKLATALQSALEDGEIIIGSPEAGMQRIPVHPGSITALTWNPGNEGDPDRPAAAPLSRIVSFEVGKATVDERKQRVGGFFNQFQGVDTVPASADVQRAQEREQVRQTVLRRDYQIPSEIAVSDGEIQAAVNFVQAIEALAGTGAMDRKIGLNSRTPTRPGDRQLRNFAVLGKTVGWKDAVGMFRICCDQNDQFQEQWDLINERFEAFFGADGNAASRRGSDAAPERN